MPEEKRTMLADRREEEAAEAHNSTQHYEVLRQLGDSCTSLGKFDEARRYYEKAASLAPDEPDPYVGLGVIALQENLLDDAEIAFRVACRLDKNCSKAYAGLAMIAQQRSDYQQAFELYLRCLELDGDNLTALLGLFQTSCQMGTFEKIIHYLQTYLNMHPGDSSVMFSLAALYMKDERLDDARKLLADLLTLDPNHSEAANLLEELDRTLYQNENKRERAG